MLDTPTKVGDSPLATLPAKNPLLREQSVTTDLVDDESDQDEKDEKDEKGDDDESKSEGSDKPDHKHKRHVVVKVSLLRF